jgi:hypothetical protein
VDDHIPIVRSVDKVSSSLPKSITMMEDFLHSCVGFCGVDTLRKHKQLYQDTVSFDNTLPDAVLDTGCYASLSKKDFNTVLFAHPQHFGDAFHIDIVFGPEISIGYIHYGLLCVDQYSHMTYIYPLQNLTTDIKKQLESFYAHLGVVPRRIISDFDLLLIGGKARDYLNGLLVHVNAAPSYRQDKNGLAECHWQTLISMARYWWLGRAPLANSYFHGQKLVSVRRTSSVFLVLCRPSCHRSMHFFSYKLEDGTCSTPFELAHHIKPDLRLLF